MNSGSDLRKLREDIGLTTRDVEAASKALARKYCNHKYVVPISRLSDFENRCTPPSIYRLYSLAVIYRCDVGDLLRLYKVGVDLSEPRANSLKPTVRSQELQLLREITFDSRKTCYLGQITAPGMEELPFAHLQQLANSDCTFGYIGTEDWTMYPLLPPATLVQVDEKCNRISSGGWASEYERPVYFVETRERYLCCWCTANRDEIILTPHPLSRASPQIVRNYDAEVLGQVIGAALPLGRKRAVPHPGPR